MEKVQKRNWTISLSVQTLPKFRNRAAKRSSLHSGLFTEQAERWLERTKSTNAHVRQQWPYEAGISPAWWDDGESRRAA